jgi:uroporphyrinogen decarboxylase
MWERLALLDASLGSLRNQLECLEKIKKNAPENVPILQTIFDPMSQAKNLVGRQDLLAHMRQSPQQLRKGLEILFENTRLFIRSCIEIGIDGIFLAVQHAQSGQVSSNEFREFVRPYDIALLEESKSLWCNLVHIHGTSIYFDELQDYPAAILNWHDQETSPSLPEAQKLTKSVVCGGLLQWDTLVYGDPESVSREAQTAIAATGGKQFILGTGCVLPIIAPRANVMAVRHSVERGNA